MLRALLILLFLCSSASGADFYINAPASVYFSPNGGCADAIVRYVDAAKVEVLVAAYSFSSIPVGDALIRAKTRGVKVEVVADSSNVTQTYSLKDKMVGAGIPIVMDGTHSIMHNKFMVIDNIFVLTGSYNYSASAETRNGENLLVIKSTQASKLYKDNFLLHKAHSVVYGGQ